MRRPGLNEPAIRVALVLSLLVHVAVVFRWPLQLRVATEASERYEKGGVLEVQLVAPPPAAPPVLALPPAPQAQHRAPPPSPPAPRAPREAARPQATPPVIALNQPAAEPAPRAQSAPAQSARPAVEGDLSTYIEARRLARAQATAPSAPASAPSAPPVEDENTRANRIAAANLGTNRTPTFGPDPRSAGIFDLRLLTYDYAEFAFFGWNKDIKRNATQLIEVRKGNQSDIRIAVVRRMIVIIREYEQEDFLWESRRLGRNVTLSARARDSAGLEEFLMREFFGATAPQ